MTTSVRSYNSKDEYHLEELTIAQLRSALAQSSHVNRMLSLENETIECYLRRREPHILPQVAQLIERTLATGRLARLRGQRRNSTSSAMTMSSASVRPSLGSSQQLSRAGPPDGTVSSSKTPKLGISYRVELALQEAEKLRSDYEIFEKTMAKKKEEINGQLNEMTERIKDCEDAHELFEKTVIQEELDGPRMTNMEKFLRFVEKQLRLSEKMVDRLTLWILGIKSTIQQIRKDIRQQKDLGSSIRPIDFEKLEISNGYLIEEVDHQTRVLNAMKKQGAHHNLQVKVQKKQLAERKQQLQALRSQVEAQRLEQQQTRALKATTGRELRAAREHLGRVQEMQETYEVPGIEELVAVQGELVEQQRRFLGLLGPRARVRFGLEA